MVSMQLQCTIHSATQNRTNYYSDLCRKWFLCWFLYAEVGSRQQISYYMAICATISLLALVVDNDIGPKGGHVITYLYASVRMRKRGIR